MSITTKKEKKQSKGVAGSGLTQKELTELKKKNPRRFEELLDMIEKKKSSRGQGAFGLGQADILLLTPEMLGADTTAPMRDTATAVANREKKFMKDGGLAEATARLKAQELSAGGTVIKTKTVAMDKSPNSGLITQRGFGASRRT